MKKRDLISLIIVIIAAIGVIWGIWYLSAEPLTPTEEVVKEKKEIEKVMIGTDMDLGDIYPKCEYVAHDIYVNDHFYDGLVAFNKEGRLTPELADYWTNPNDLTWEMHLRKGVKFHNGDELTAEDVKFSIEETLKEENAFPTRENILVIDKVEIVDPYTVKITTKKPFPILLNKMADTFIFSKEYIEKNGYDADPVGTGPYKFVKWEKEKEIVLERNESYFGTLPLVKKVVFKPYVDKEERINSLIKGETDLITQLGIADIDRIEQAEGVHPAHRATISVAFLGIDIARDKSPYVDLPENPFKKLEVRQALAYGIDKEEIVKEIFKGKGEIATQLVTPEIYGYNPEIKSLPYDPAKAKKLLEEAGYKNGFKVIIDVPDDERAKAVEMMKKQLGNIGIEIEVNAKPRKETFGKILSGDTSLYVIAWICESMDAGEVLDYLLHTPTEELGSINMGGYSNAEVDELIKKASATVDQKLRLQYMQSALKIATEEIAVVPLYTMADVNGVSDKIKWTPRANGAIAAWEMSPK